ncbi:MAG: FAD-dependent oxidoreductase [Nitrospirae bacterium]|nr:FAD-dependent oxidoreductase [Nitrospirota bacterium]
MDLDKKGKYDVIVVGAGISGLSFAYYCGREGLSTLIIEKDRRVGGTLHSHSFEGLDGFWIELGAHTCYNSYSNLLAIIENCGILDQLTRREKVPFRMLVNSGIKSIPSQLDFLELLRAAPHLFTLKQEGQTVESYYSKIAGLSNFRRVIGPAINAVLSQTADNFPAEFVFKKRRRRKDILKKFTLSHGLQTIAESVASQAAIQLITGEKVLAVTTRAGIFQVAAGEKLYEADSLVVATPASVASQLLRASFPELSEKLARIECVTVESMGTAINKQLVPICPVAGLIPSSDSFYSVVTRDTVCHREYRGFTFHFKPGLLSREAKLERIAEVLGVDKGQLSRVVEKENMVPSLKSGHNALVGEIDQLISGRRLFVTGNYFGGMAIEDCVTRSLDEFERSKTFFGASHGG